MDSAVLTEVCAVRETLLQKEVPVSDTAVQICWAERPIRERLAVLRVARHTLAGMTHALAQAISSELVRTPADTRVAEILPLLAACQFLERNAERILRPKRLGRRGLPFWLAGVESEVHRVTLGHVLVIGPANYPLFLPGVQTLQALAAGNAVTWKPGRWGREVAKLFAEALRAAGLPDGLLCITEESVEAVQDALALAPAKVFFTGSAETGRMLMRRLAETLTPCVMELSGCDAVMVLPSANFDRVVQALKFGLRLNGSATCMAPRRVLLMGASARRRESFVSMLISAVQEVRAITLPARVRSHLESLLKQARLAGAEVHGDLNAEGIHPLVVTGVQPGMEVAKADVFAPVLSVIDVANEAELLEAQEACPFALTTAIFGDESEARRLATKITAGSVLINDLIVPTADPRVPFGGRRQSGFGVTRGAEGLLEMTAVKTIAVRRGRNTRHFEETTVAHEGLFNGLIAAAHASSWTERWRGVRQVAAAGSKLRGKR